MEPLKARQPMRYTIIGLSSGPLGYTTFFMLNSDEYEILC